MRRFSVAILSCFILATLFMRVGVVAQTSDSASGAGDAGAGELVDIRAELVYPYKINDSVSVLCLVGNFSAQHNGAVITADSAVRYDDERLECYGDVLINKNTTYAYADRADYDSRNNTAALYSKLVKVVDQDVTMYAYNFNFNTLENFGFYWGGGVTIQRDSLGAEDLMESKRGYYYADTKQVIGVESVELSGEGYLMKGDSVIYEMEGKRAHFFKHTNIWNEDDNYIYGDRGSYDKAQNLYVVSRNGYFLNKEQEAWSDSLEYYRERQMAILRSNIQIDDTTHKSLAFGDYAQYWGASEEILLTRRPSVINYDKTQGDSLFLRGDTIRLLTYAIGTGPVADQKSSANSEREKLLAELSGGVAEDARPENDHDHDHHDHDHDHDHGDHDHAPMEADTLSTDVVEETIQPADTIPTKRELKALAREAKIQQRRDAYNQKLYHKLEVKRDKLIERIEEKRAKGRSIYADSIVLERVKNEMRGDVVADVADTLSIVAMDSLAMLSGESTKQPDSLYRIIKSYRNVRSYRSDSQMVCDSLVAISCDSMLRLYISPIMWNGSNQIVADQMDIYSKGGNLDYAEFFGKPIMASQIFPNDSTNFNQVSGQYMISFFVDNSVERNDVDGNVQTVYYVQDENTKEITTLANIVSGSASFFIKEQALDGVIYRAMPVYAFAPIEMVPADMKRNLDGFKWESSRRPTRNMVFDRRIRPTEREEKSALELPKFPIKAQVDADRAKFVLQGEWRDRDENVSEDATAWMKSLGFTPGEPREDDSLGF